jgi:hypothetical protein
MGYFRKAESTLSSVEIDVEMAGMIEMRAITSR